jgi:hypothetical protein
VRDDATRGDGAGEIADQVGGTEIGGVRRAEPAALDQRRQQGRVGEAGEADADQGGAQAGDRRAELSQRRRPS